jgi:integrase
MGKPLTAIKVEKAGPGMHADGGGLYLQVGAARAKSWIYRYTLKGKQRYLGLGSANAITLARARELAADARRLRAEKKDPIEHRREEERAKLAEAATALPFDEAVARYIAAHETSWKNAKHRQQWRNTLAKYASPVIGAVFVKDIDTGMVMQVIEPIWHQKPETAGRLRGRVETILDWAKARGYRDGDNPARWRGHIQNLLPRKTKVRKVKHHPAMAYGDVPAFMDGLRQRTSISARALAFTVLTAARTSETLHAKWSEIDVGKAVWTIPSERMKAGLEHRVPLSKAALAILAKLPRDGELVFGRNGAPMSENALLKMLALMGRNDVTVHGFRSSFRDWAAECTNFPRELAEKAIAHAVGDETERAYQRGELLEKRRRLMAAWSDYCGKVQPAKPASNVTQLRSVAR